MSATINLNANTLTVGADNTTPVDPVNASSGTYAGTIAGTGGITKIGSGTLTLGGANTYTGSTTISGGTLQIGNGGTTGTLGTGPVIDDAALRINRSDAITVANAISGSGTLTQAGSGTTTLSGGTGNTYTGLTTVSAGTLNLDKSSGNAIGGDLTISGGNVTYAAGRSHQIADTAAVTISSGNFNGTALNAGVTTNITETIGSMTVTGGSFQTGRGPSGR